MVRLLQNTTLSFRYGIVLVLLSCLVYANTLKNTFVLDDVMMITQNTYVKQGVKGIPTLLSTSQLRGYYGNLATDKYRPLALVTFAIEYELFGLNPMPYHLLNVLCY